VNSAGSALANALSGQRDRLLPCVRCGLCLPVCPTYVRMHDDNDSPRGRLYLMRAVVEGRIDPGAEAFQTHIDRCLGCLACETVCPAGVEYGILLEHARAVAVAAQPQPWLIRTLLGVFQRPGRTRTVMRLSRWLRASGLAGLGAWILPRRWHTLRLGLAMLSASSGSNLRRLGRRRRAALPAASVGPPDAYSSPPDTDDENELRPARVGLLSGCVQAGLFERVNDASRRVLKANGFAAVTPSTQGCCGALHSHAGDLECAKALARVNIAAFESADVETVVVNAAGCGAAMKGYAQLLADDAEYATRAAAISEKIVDISEILVRYGLRQGAPVPARVTYDAPCHLLHAQGVAEAPLEMLRSVPQLELVELEGGPECCGGAGIYGITHRDLAEWIGSDKVDAILETKAEAVATGNPGCMMHIGAGLRFRGAGIETIHPVELVDESYRRGGLY
jgi:glycolate dehydrogenase iron-sulfur subunit